MVESLPNMQNDLGLVLSSAYPRYGSTFQPLGNRAWRIRSEAKPQLHSKLKANLGLSENHKVHSFKKKKSETQLRDREVVGRGRGRGKKGGREEERERERGMNLNLYIPAVPTMTDLDAHRTQFL